MRKISSSFHAIGLQCHGEAESTGKGKALWNPDELGNVRRFREGKVVVLCKQKASLWVSTMLK